MHRPNLAQRVVALDVGVWFLGQAQGLRSTHDRRCDRLAVDQPVQEIEDVDLGRHAGRQRHVHCRQHDLLVMLQDEGQDLDLLPAAAMLPEQILLQSPDGLGQLIEGRAVAQSAGLAISLQGRVQTWVTSQWKNRLIPGQFSAEIHKLTVCRQPTLLDQHAKSSVAYSGPPNRKLRRKPFQIGL